MTIQALFILCASLLILSTPEVHSSGVLTIRLTGFQNPFGRTYDGTCCDPNPRDYGAMCVDQCDYVMRLIVSGLGRANDHVFLFHRPLKYDSNNIVFENDDSNLILTVLYDRWPSDGQVKMNAFFYDYDDYDHTTTLVDWFETDLRHQEIPASAKTDRLGQFQEQTVTGNRQNDKTILTFDWSALCHEDECRLSYANEDGTNKDSDLNKDMLQGTQRRMNPFGDSFTGGQMSPFKELDSKVEYYDEYNNKNENLPDHSISGLDDSFHDQEGSFMFTTLPADNESDIGRIQRWHAKPRKDPDIAEAVLKRRRDKIRALGRFKDTLIGLSNSEVGVDERQPPTHDFSKSQAEIGYEETLQNSYRKFQDGPGQRHNKGSLEAEHIPSSFRAKHLNRGVKKQGIRKMKDGDGASIFSRDNLQDILYSYETSTIKQAKNANVLDTVSKTSGPAEDDRHIQQPSRSMVPEPLGKLSRENKVIKRKQTLRKSLLRKRAEATRSSKNHGSEQEKAGADSSRQISTKTSQDNMALSHESVTNDNGETPQNVESYQTAVHDKVSDNSQNAYRRITSKRPHLRKERVGSRIRTNLGPASKLNLLDSNEITETPMPDRLTPIKKANDKLFYSDSGLENPEPLVLSKARGHKKIKRFKPGPYPELVTEVPSHLDQDEKYSLVVTNEVTSIPINWWNIFTKGPDDTPGPKWAESDTFKTRRLTSRPTSPADVNESISSYNPSTLKPFRSKPKTAFKEKSVLWTKSQTTPNKNHKRQTKPSQRKIFNASKKRQQTEIKTESDTQRESETTQKTLTRSDQKNNSTPLSKGPKVEVLSPEIAQSVTSSLTPKPNQERVKGRNEDWIKGMKIKKGTSRTSFGEKKSMIYHKDFEEVHNAHNRFLKNTRKSSVAVTDNVKHKTYNNVHTSIPQTVNTVTSKRPMASPQTSEKKAYSHITKAWKFDESNEYSEIHPPKASSAPVVKGLAYFEESGVTNQTETLIEKNERKNSSNNINKDSGSVRVTGRWWSIFTVSPDNTLVPNWTKGSRSGRHETSPTPDNSKSAYTTQNPRLAEAPHPSTRRPNKKQTLPGTVPNSLRGSIDNAILDPFRLKNISKPLIQRKKEASTRINTDGTKLPKHFSFRKDERAAHNLSVGKLATDNIQRNNYETNSQKRKPNENHSTKNNAPKSLGIGDMKSVRDTLDLTTLSTYTNTESHAGELISEMIQNEEVKDIYVTEPVPKLRRFKQKVKYVPSNREIQRNNIKKLKSFRSQTAAPGHWYVTAQRFYKKVVSRPLHFKQAEATSKLQFNSNQKQSPSNIKEQLVGPVHAEKSQVAKSKKYRNTIETPPNRVKADEARFPGENKDASEKLLKRVDVLSSHGENEPTNLIAYKKPYNRKRTDSFENKDQNKRKQAVITPVKDAMADNPMLPVHDSKERVFFPTLQMDTRANAEKESNINPDGPFGVTSSLIVSPEDQKNRPYHSQQARDKDITYNRKKMEYQQTRVDNQMDSTSYSTSSDVHQGREIRREEINQKAKNSKLEQNELFTRQLVRIQRLDDDIQDEAVETHTYYVPGYRNTHHQDRNAHSESSIVLVTDKLDNNKEIAFNHISKTTRSYATPSIKGSADYKRLNTKIRTKTLLQKAKVGTQRPFVPLKSTTTTRVPKITKFVVHETTKPYNRNLQNNNRKDVNREADKLVLSRKEVNNVGQKPVRNISTKSVPSKTVPFRGSKETTTNDVFQTYTRKPGEEQLKKERKYAEKSRKSTTRRPFSSEPSFSVSLIKETSAKENSHPPKKNISIPETHQKVKVALEPVFLNPKPTQIIHRQHGVEYSKSKDTKTVSINHETMRTNEGAIHKQKLHEKRIQASNNTKNHANKDNGRKNQQIFQPKHFTNNKTSLATLEKKDRPAGRNDLRNNASKFPDSYKVKEPTNVFSKNPNNRKNTSIKEDSIKLNLEQTAKPTPAWKKKELLFFNFVGGDIMKNAMEETLSDDNETDATVFEAPVGPISQNTMIHFSVTPSTESVVEIDKNKNAASAVSSRDKLVNVRSSSRRLSHDDDRLFTIESTTRRKTFDISRDLNGSEAPKSKREETEQKNELPNKNSYAQSSNQVMKSEDNIEEKHSFNIFVDTDTMPKSKKPKSELKTLREKKIESDAELPHKLLTNIAEIPLAQKRNTTLSPPYLKTSPKSLFSETQNKTARDPFDLMSLFRANTNLMYSIKSMENQQKNVLSDKTFPESIVVKKNLTEDMTVMTSLVPVKAQSPAASTISLYLSTLVADLPTTFKSDTGSVKEDTVNQEKVNKASQRNTALGPSKKEVQVTENVANTFKLVTTTIAKVNDHTISRHPNKMFSATVKYADTTAKTESAKSEHKIQTTMSLIPSGLRNEPSTTAIKLSSKYTEAAKDETFLTTTVAPEHEKTVMTSVTTKNMPKSKIKTVGTQEENTSGSTATSTFTSPTVILTTKDQETTKQEVTNTLKQTVQSSEMPKNNISDHSTATTIKLSSKNKEMTEEARITQIVRVTTNKVAERPVVFQANKKALPVTTNNSGKHDYLLGMKSALYIPKKSEMITQNSFKNSMSHNSKAYNSIRLLLPEERTLPEDGFVLHTLPDKHRLSKTTNHPFFVHRRPNLSRNPSQVNVQRKINLDKLRHYIKGIRYGPTVNVPLQGLYTPFPNDDLNNDTLSLARLPHPGKRLGTPYDSISDVGTVFTRYWPAVLGVIIGTIFLLTALLTSLYCRQRRLLVQRARWVDSPQHVSEPPDTSEYATSSAASLTSDLTRSSINLM